MNQVQNQHRDTLTIDLIHKEPLYRPVPRIVDRICVPPPVSDSGVTLDELGRNYRALISTGVVFYPVAYEILRQIGSGRQGTVLLALRHGARGCTTEHAIKVFDPKLYRSAEEYWTDMGRIAYQVCQLHHLQSPNLVSTSFYEETNGIGYIQMEAIDGLDLRRFMTKESLERARNSCTQKEWQRFTTTIFRIHGDEICLQPGVAIHIMRGVLRGLERVHALNFLHYDIKPGNIMIDRLGDIKLVDFGRAVVIGEKLSFLLGSPMYMAPETHRREPGSIQSDFYSLGLVAVEMLRGRRFSESEDISEDELLRLKLDLPNRLSEMLPSHVLTNKTLMYILHKFLAPDPAMRYSSARDAEAGDEGLRLISKQLVQADLDAEYALELSDYMSNFVDPGNQRVDNYISRVETSAREADPPTYRL